MRAATDLLLLLGLLALLIDALGDHLVVHLGLGLRLLDASADGRLPLALALISRKIRRGKRACGDEQRAMCLGQVMGM